MLMDIIVVTSYFFSLVSFVLFLYFALMKQKKSKFPIQEAATLGDAQQKGSIEDLAELLKAIAQLSDSFSKAGPMVMSLVSAILFLLVAAMGAGFDKLAKAIGT